MAIALPSVAAGLGLGLALASAPGPVQAVLLGESVRGGVRRGFRALAGASLTFAILLLVLALGLSFAPPTGIVLRVLELAGGVLLLWLAFEGFRAADEEETDREGRRTLPPAVRGSLAVLLNPGAWLFLGAVASPLFANAALEGGRPTAVLAALALVFGLGVGDAAVVLLGGFGLRRAKREVTAWVRRGLAILLAALGVWLIIRGATP